MVRLLVSSAYHIQRPHKIPPLIPQFQYCASRPKSHHLCPDSRYVLQLLDEMPQRVTFDTTTPAILFKTLSADPSLAPSIHCHLIKANFLLRPAFRTSLLTAYARAADTSSSLSLFDEDSARDVISWNAIINACFQNRDFITYADLLQEMSNDFQEFDSTTLVIALSASACTGNLKQGEILHAAILKRRPGPDPRLPNALMNMYAKCGDLASSEHVFEGAAARDAASWNSMITGNLHNGFPRESVLYFREMARSAIRPDQISLSSVISACSCSSEFRGFGESTNSWATKAGCRGLPGSSVENALISFYFYHGDVQSAKEVFNGMLHKNIVSWNSVIYGLVESERSDEALELFRGLALKPNAVTLISIVPACRKLDLLLCVGKSIHGFEIRRQMDPSNPSVANCLLDMYLSYEDHVSAELLFRSMPSKDSVSWNTMISGRSKNAASSFRARALFREFLRQDLRCSLATILGILPSCKDSGDLDFGKSVHGRAIGHGFGRDASAVNALMLMYINCGEALSSPQQLLRSIVDVADIISMNTIIAGCARRGLYEDAIEMLLHSMRCSFEPDPITFVSALSAFGNLRSARLGRSMHALMEKSAAGLDVMARNALITMYFRCGDSISSELVFRTCGNPNRCSWNCMISGFAQSKKGEKALEYLKGMGSYRADEFAVVGAICACSQMGNLRCVKEVHGYWIKTGMRENCFVSSSLLDAYSKCGRLDDSIRVFDGSAESSVALWNSMISALGIHGKGGRAIEAFADMRRLGIQPTKSTFIAVLSACGHSGLIDEGCRHYRIMEEEFGLEPSIEHKVCVAEMLGRAGRIREAYEFVLRIPSSESETGIWGAVLSSCADHSNIEIGESVAGNLFCLEPDNIGYYITLSNLYAFYGMWSRAEDLRRMIHKSGMFKPSGKSLLCH